MSIGDEHLHSPEARLNANSAIGSSGTSDFARVSVAFVGNDGSVGEVRELTYKSVGAVA